MSKYQGCPEKVYAALRCKAEAGNALAQYELAAVLASDSINECNIKDSFYWYMKAALRGHVEAMCNAGIQLLQGVGVERSIEAGLYLVHLSASRCCYKAFRLLGDIYLMGLYGVEIDRRKGEYWYRQAEGVRSIDKV
jgi:TPR repeat protein